MDIQRLQILTNLLGLERKARDFLVSGDVKEAIAVLDSSPTFHFNRQNYLPDYDTILKLVLSNKKLSRQLGVLILSTVNREISSTNKKLIPEMAELRELITILNGEECKQLLES